MSQQHNPPPPHGLVQTLLTAVQQHGAPDVLRALVIVLETPARIDTTPELRAAMTVVAERLAPAVEAAWHDWPYR